MHRVTSRITTVFLALAPLPGGWARPLDPRVRPEELLLVPEEELLRLGLGHWRRRLTEENGQAGLPSGENNAQLDSENSEESGLSQYSVIFHPGGTSIRPPVNEPGKDESGQAREASNVENVPEEQLAALLGKDPAGVVMKFLGPETSLQSRNFSFHPTSWPRLASWRGRNGHLPKAEPSKYFRDPHAGAEYRAENLRGRDGPHRDNALLKYFQSMSLAERKNGDAP